MNTVAGASQLADLYRDRWLTEDVEKIETIKKTFNDLSNAAPYLRPEIENRNKAGWKERSQYSQLTGSSLLPLAAALMGELKTRGFRYLTIISYRYDISMTFYQQKVWLIIPGIRNHREATKDEQIRWM